MVVRKVGGEFQAIGTPWPGDAGIAVNRRVSLSGEFFLHHVAHAGMRRIEKRKALEKLLPVASSPWYDRDVVPRMLSFSGNLMSHVPAFELRFRPNPEVVNFL